jgi:hypothetical protein
VEQYAPKPIAIYHWLDQTYLITLKSSRVENPPAVTLGDGQALIEGVDWATLRLSVMSTRFSA